MTIMVREEEKKVHFKENTDRLRRGEEGLIEVEEVPIRVIKTENCCIL